MSMKDTLEQIVEAIQAMPVTMGSGLFGKIYEYSRAAVLAVEQLVDVGKVQPDDQSRKDAAMHIVEAAAKVDEVPFGAAEGESFTFDQVLAVNNDNELVIGTPCVAGATVSATVLGEGKAKKVIVYRYKRKSGYHKKNGHRQAYTQVKIDAINA